MGEQQMSQEYLDSLEQQIEAMPRYVREISEAMVILAKAVESALNMRDMAVIREMKAVSHEIFMQAETILNSDTRNIQ